MGKRLEPNIILELKTQCCENGFIRKGNAYFRVINRAVLQVIRFKYERVMDHYDLRFGLFSLFSPLEKQWLTSYGCIPRHSIVNLQGGKSPVVLHNSNGFMTVEIISPAQQLEVLKSHGFRWLDGVQTQQRLIQALNELDIISSGEIRWNDDLRIEPYLETGQLDLADRVIAAMFQQRVAARRWTNLPWTEKDFVKYEQLGFETILAPGADTDLMQIHKWIRDKDQSRIDAYLQNNYSRNIQLAKHLF